MGVGSYVKPTLNVNDFQLKEWTEASRAYSLRGKQSHNLSSGV